MNLVWLSLLLVFTTVKAEVATSGYKLTVMCEKEGKLVEKLDRYVTISLDNKSHVDETVQRFLNHVQEERSMINNIEQWMGHPINAFHLIDRAVNGWGKVVHNINCSTCVPTMAAQEFLSAWESITDEDGIWTSKNDFTSAAFGLARLYEIYDFDLKTMVSGTILNIRASPLTSSNIVNIAQALETEKQIAWYEAFQEIADVTERDSILYKTAIAYHLTGLSMKALDILTNLQQTSTRSLETMTKIVRLKAESQEENQQEDKEVGSQNPLDIVYKQLCKTQTSLITSDLHCYNKKTRIPYYTAKEEVLSNVPRISRFHDVISDKEILHLQDIAKQNLTRARVFKGDNQEVDGSRTGDSASLKIRTSTTVKLEKRIELLTGLDASVGRDIKTSDKLQVVNYGLGGHYSRHYDCRTETAMHHGNYTRNERIATWIFYLNDVEAGGATVFPLLKIRIVPIKGSAVFWYNLMPSGEPDFRSQHAACPVILGTKWITTKWIRELGQELRKPCKTQYSAEHF